MLKRGTHAIFGMGTTLLFFSHGLDSVLELIPIALIGSLFPDIDVRYRHRALAHNVFSLLAFYFILFFIYLYIGNSYMKAMNFASAGAYAYSTHILLDSFTYNGVRLFWPIKKKRYGLRFFGYDDRLANIVIAALGALSLIISVTR